jgi:AcrR family transcriptional regulator
VPVNGLTSCLMERKRQYVLKQRAEQQAETRRRIVEATVGLHLEVGPASTQITEVARRAGVQRATVYNHFSSGEALLAACSAHWRDAHPMPDPQAWNAVDDPGERLLIALGALYAWYRETRDMTANVLRDAGVLPPLRDLLDRGLLRIIDSIAESLVEPFAATGRRRHRIRHATSAVTDFHFWQALEPLGDHEAARLGAGLVLLAAADSRT